MAATTREDMLELFDKFTHELEDSGQLVAASTEDIRRVVHSATEAARTSLRLSHRVGTFYTTARVRDLLGISRQALNARVERDSLLRVRTADGTYLFPAFQFTEPQGPSALFRRIIKTLLGAGMDPWTVTYWLTASSPATGHSATPLEIIDSGTTTERSRLIAEADDQAARWRDHTR
ncbi:hypothetical protein [Kocuria massiliensis]|uniref:hypothetical protein n=1 Tax=Kocuria massiliensis TaxID=1926282 RepID=UPI0022B9682E|nr:hypothetical protein [Kocuria massiliensis]